MKKDLEMFMGTGHVLAGLELPMICLFYISLGLNAALPAKTVQEYSEPTPSPGNVLNMMLA